jgi:hypothetical protein
MEQKTQKRDAEEACREGEKPNVVHTQTVCRPRRRECGLAEMKNARRVPHLLRGNPKVAGNIALPLILHSLKIRKNKCQTKTGKRGLRRSIQALEKAISK